MSLPQIDPVTAAVLQLSSHLSAVSSRQVAAPEAAGLVLAEPIMADRDNPPLNVSAMDGYALRIADAHKLASRLPVSATATAGRPAPPLPPEAAVRIFTGAPVPDTADCVVPREQTRESAQLVELFNPPNTLIHGQHIRWRGENAKAGSQVLSAGQLITSNVMAAAASVARGPLQVFRRVRVAIVNTGDELIEPGQAVLDWQIRDSNGPTLATLLSQHRWLEVVGRSRAADDLQTIASALRDSLHTADAVLLTGGVSMGDTDHVPAAIESIGGRIVFHRLPIRPGKPVLGAVSNTGQLIIGLPGNPVSVSVTATVVALPLLRQLAGFAEITPAQPRVFIDNPDDKQLALTWYRLAAIAREGQVRLVDTRGSGDLISLGQSHGFVTIPSGASGTGPWPWTSW